MHYRFYYVLVVLLVASSVSVVLGEDTRLNPSQVREWNVFVDKVNEVCDTCEGNCDCINEYFHPFSFEKYDLNDLPLFSEYEQAAQTAQDRIDTYYEEVALIQKNCKGTYYHNYDVPKVPAFSIPHSTYLKPFNTQSIIVREVPNSTTTFDSNIILTDKFPVSTIDNEKTILTKELPVSDPNSQVRVISATDEEWMNKDLRSYLKESYARNLKKNQESVEEIGELYHKVFNTSWDQGNLLMGDLDISDPATGGTAEDRVTLQKLMNDYYGTLWDVLSNDAAYWAEKHYGTDSAEYVLITSAFVIPTPELLEYASETSVSYSEGATLAKTKLGDILKKYGYP